MRVIIALFILLMMAPAEAAGRDAVADAYYACLVGKGAIEVNYGATADASLATADKLCAKEAAPLAKRKPTSDMGDDVEAVYEAASAAIDKLVN